MLQKSSLERLITMDRNRQAHDTSLLTVDVVTAMDPKKLPSFTLDCSREFLPRN